MTMQKCFVFEDRFVSSCLVSVCLALDKQQTNAWNSSCQPIYGVFQQPRMFCVLFLLSVVLYLHTLRMLWTFQTFLPCAGRILNWETSPVKYFKPNSVNGNLHSPDTKEGFIHIKQFLNTELLRRVKGQTWIDKIALPWNHWCKWKQ